MAMASQVCVILFILFRPFLSRPEIVSVDSDGVAVVCDCPL